MIQNSTQEPRDADERRAAAPVICYTVDQLPPLDHALHQAALASLELVETVVVPPRDGRVLAVPRGHVFRIRSVDGPQVGDLNLWNAHDLGECFYSGKTRQLQASHVSTGDRLWSSVPHLRPLATIIDDTLGWYGRDKDGAGVHDVIGTRCDPYTNHLLSGTDYHYCCHSNLTRALANYTGLPLHEAERHVHDVMNVFMCTGFTLDTQQYFMKASPVRPGDHIDFLAEIDLLVGLSACPGGDCSATHSNDQMQCYPLHVDVLKPVESVLLAHAAAKESDYDRSHGHS
jgi:uncharacterized protein YcgI (DUF1989 family)